MVSKSPVNPLMLVGQVVFYGLFAVIIGYFSTSPDYTHLEPDKALIKLSFSTHGEPVGECRDRTPEELAKLAPNMRKARVCPRERSPITVKIDLDGHSLFEGVAPPTGLSKDGTSNIYRRFEVPAGEHLLSVKMNDNVRIQDFNYIKEERLTLQPAQILVIDLRKDHGGIFFE
ncbi:MAG: hypothetical protein LBE33_07620 [Zoogloeaceae bacterium]|jgi:hypothetical protein|nr:hypothetical protein [Zoogloeaceae bacterium]